MKEIGIVRRVDQLGRIVLPMEIRKLHRIREGTLLELYEENDTIILKPYSPIENYRRLAEDLLDSNNAITNIVVADREAIIATNKNCSKLLGTKLADEINNLGTKSVMIDSKSAFCPFLREMEEQYYLIRTIVKDGDIYGFVIIFDYKLISVDYQNFANIVCEFLSRQC